MEQASLTEVFEFFSLPTASRRRLAGYQELLGQARELGLVGFPPSASAEHLARALLLRDLLRDGSVIDVGSGAGLPGIPLACLGLTVVLVEPRRKAAAFCEKAIRELALDAEVVIATAAQAADSGLRAPNVVARALAEPTVALGMCLALVKTPGRVLLTGAPSAAFAPPEMKSCQAKGPLDIVQTILMMDTPSPDIPDHPRERQR